MGVKQSIKDFTKLVIGLISLLSTFYTIVDFMFFLSNPNYRRKPAASNDEWLTASRSLLINMLLLSLFILQHTLLALPGFKNAIRNWGFQDLTRSFYVITTAACLEILIRNWHDIPEITLWKFNVNFKPSLILYGAIHFVAWAIIYAGNIFMDINELIGIKQIYYSLINLPDPNLRKSYQLQRLNTHIRHPSFLAFLVIFWTVPIMSLDRLLLAVILTIYMFISWNTDESDYAYQHSQYIRKCHELKTLGC